MLSIAFVPLKKSLGAMQQRKGTSLRQYFHVQKFITYQDTDKKQERRKHFSRYPKST